MSDSPDLSALIARALREMSAAMKVIAFYPSHHPSVVSTLEKMKISFREALAGQESLRLGVSESSFILSGQPVAGEDRLLSGFATYLSRRAVGALVFRSPVEVEALKGFVEVMAIDPATLRARGGPARCLEERRLGGVSIEEFDPAEALRSARTGASGPGDERENRPAASWSDLMARFLLGQEAAPPGGGAEIIRKVAVEAGAARELLASLQSMTAAASVADRGVIMLAALKRAASEVAQADAGALPSLAENLAGALSELEPANRLEVLNASIPVPGTGFDLGREIRARIPPDRLGEMIVSLVRSQGKLTPRLTSVVRKVLIDTGGAERNREGILAAVQAAKGPGEDPLEDVWSSIESLLEESEDQWLAREYKGLLEFLGDTPPTLDEALRQELADLPGFMESLSEEGIRRQAWLLFADLLEIETVPARQWVALDQIEKRAARMRPAWFLHAGEVAGTVRSLLERRPGPEPHVREAGVKALQAVAANLTGSYRQHFHATTPPQREALVKSFDALGPYALDPLLAGLEHEQDWEIRRTFLTFLAARGKEAVPLLVRRLSDRSWYLVRNLLLVLGEIADPSTVPAIATALKHPEPRVRRDAVAALEKIGGARAFTLVRECLGDPEVAEVATRCLAVIDRPRTVAAFLEMTGPLDLLGRGNARLREAINALGALGASESVPRLQEILMRGLWFPPSAGDGVRIAAARALEKIGTAAALRAVARGARVWRSPVRATCSEIVGGRAVSADLDNPN
ncbi:MAG TPA: HEAT repeat domain-containing protein [Candidatus Polarisedimenticolia bacterium]|nr:HEAT repeat domain-containing protein [Candidatus Polarisedimenticolia bacterium]